MSELGKRDSLYNAVLNTVKECGCGMEIGLVRAVLAEVDGDIVRGAYRNELDTVCDKLPERRPRNDVVQQKT